MTGRLTAWLAVFAWAFGGAAVAAEPWQPIERRLPPAGIEISPSDREQLEVGLASLQQRITEYKTSGDAETDLLVDVEIYAKAVRFALEESEFSRPQDVDAARQLIATAKGRLEELASGQLAWTKARGLVVRGYRSAVDGTVQPYGLEIPENLDTAQPVPLYVWLHGRNDKLADLQFIAERASRPGRIQVDDAIVLHPFGRSCLGWKSTAEVDVFEAIAAVSAAYPIDRDRVVLMGFSMGGAGAWHIGAHYADRWAAVHAGAGFVDVARYQKLAPADYPPPYEQALWGLYDVPGYVRNLLNLPVVAYSGEVDKQKDAADFMAESFRSHDRELVHLIGPGMAHKYDPAVLEQVIARMRSATAQGREAKSPAVSLQTRTLRYHRLRWVEALGLEKHWRDSRIDATYAAAGRLDVHTKNIQSFRLRPPKPVARLVIDGQELQTSDAGSLEFEKQGSSWIVASNASPPGLRKRPGLQGPIDDVLMDPFLVVLPTGKTMPEVQKWIDFELDHFQRRWKNVYRGQLRVKRDVDVTDDDCQKYHLIAWGDVASNALVRRLVNQLPIDWTADKLTLGSHSVDAATHVPLLIYPNPLNREKYIVLNSGPTHRESHDRTNSLQNPKLGDWAIVEVTVPPDGERPGGVVAAGFFDEAWQLGGR